MRLQLLVVVALLACDTPTEEDTMPRSASIRLDATDPTNPVPVSGVARSIEVRPHVALLGDAGPQISGGFGERVMLSPFPVDVVAVDRETGGQERVTLHHPGRLDFPSARSFFLARTPGQPVVGEVLSFVPPLDLRYTVGLDTSPTLESVPTWQRVVALEAGGWYAGQNTVRFIIPTRHADGLLIHYLNSAPAVGNTIQVDRMTFTEKQLEFLPLETIIVAPGVAATPESYLFTSDAPAPAAGHTLARGPFALADFTRITLTGPGLGAAWFLYIYVRNR